MRSPLIAVTFTSADAAIPPYRAVVFGVKHPATALAVLPGGIIPETGAVCAALPPRFRRAFDRTLQYGGAPGWIMTGTPGDPASYRLRLPLTTSTGKPTGEITAAAAPDAASIYSDLATEDLHRRLWPISAIRAHSLDSGCPFFSRKTMRFFGDIAACFRARYVRNRILIERVRATSPYLTLGRTWEFDPETGSIG